MQLSTYGWFGVGAISILFVLTVITLQMSSSFSRFIGLGAGQPAAVGVAGTNEMTTLEVAQSVAAGQVDDLIINEISRGSGQVVQTGDRVVVHYVGTLSTGEQFDSSRDRGEPFTFTVGAGRVIAGWEQGLVGMREGGTRVLVIPPHLAYGSRPVGSIPANSTLVFTIELLEIR